MNTFQLVNDHNQVRMRNEIQWKTVGQTLKNLLSIFLIPFSEHGFSHLLPYTHKQITTTLLIEDKEWKILIPKYGRCNWKFLLPSKTFHYNEVFNDPNSEDQIELSHENLLKHLQKTAEKIASTIKLPLENYQFIWEFNHENTIDHCFVFKPDTIHISKKTWREHRDWIKWSWKRVYPHELITHPDRKKSAIKQIITDYYNLPL